MKAGFFSALLFEIFNGFLVTIFFWPAWCAKTSTCTEPYLIILFAAKLCPKNWFGPFLSEAFFPVCRICRSYGPFWFLFFPAPSDVIGVACSTLRSLLIWIVKTEEENLHRSRGVWEHRLPWCAWRGSQSACCLWGSWLQVWLCPILESGTAKCNRNTSFLLHGNHCKSPPVCLLVSDSDASLNVMSRDKKIFR